MPCRIGAAEEAQHAFDYMRTQGIWQPGDTLTVNYLLDALSSNSEAAFERCAPGRYHLYSTLPT